MKTVYNPFSETFDLVTQQSTKSTSFTVLPNQQLDTAIQIQDFRYLITQIPKAPQKLSIKGTFDPDDVSSDRANLINGNYDDLCYNNRSKGSTNKALPAIDLGAIKQVDFVALWWWRDNYTARNFKIQGSTNGTTWQDIAINQRQSVAGRQDIAINAQVQYLRLFSVNGRNRNWVVLSEMEAYAVPSEVDQYFNTTENKVSLFVQDNTLLISNNTNQTITIIINH